ncbi:MAG: hypothetical protein GXP57_01650 [Deltaproteobacteria bacterium]|nr:hypothetical protein [Deltaproteobacteria bacterium]
MDEKTVAENGYSRRSFLADSGKVIAGAAVASSLLTGQAKEAKAYPYSTGYKYTKLDPKEVGRITYENYFKRWCASSIVAGFVEPLRKKVGGLWKSYPIDAMRWAHGGLAGWGATCGTLNGAGAVIGLVTNNTDTAEEMVNDLAFYYSYTELPSYAPAKIIKAKIHNMTLAGTIICHISVGRWMRSEDVSFLSDARAERCARMAANIAMETAGMLNDWSDGKYKPKHKLLFNLAANGITSQNNCMDCHGQNVPGVETYSTLKK